MLACLPAAAPADEITVKGTTLRGTIKSMSASELQMDTEYGKGTLVIKMKDDDWATNYLLRTEAALLFPMTDILNLKFSLLDEFNNQPAEEATRNNLATTLGLSLVY
jgi:hypothetical protein